MTEFKAYHFATIIMIIDLGKKSSMVAKTSRLKKQDICIASKYLLTNHLPITKAKIETFQASNTLTKGSKLTSKFFYKFFHPFTSFVSVNQCNISCLYLSLGW